MCAVVIPNYPSERVQAGTSTGRALGSIVGSNLAAFTAELGGKVTNLQRYLWGKNLTFFF
jgi:hypothetical protein